MTNVRYYYLEKHGEHDIRFMENHDKVGTIWVKIPTDFEKRNPSWDEFPTPVSDARKYWNQLVSEGYKPFFDRPRNTICEAKPQ